MFSSTFLANCTEISTRVAKCECILNIYSLRNLDWMWLESVRPMVSNVLNPECEENGDYGLEWFERGFINSLLLLNRNNSNYGRE